MKTVSSARLPFPWPNLLVALLALLPFVPGLPGEFVFDDFPNIVNNPAIQIVELDRGTLTNLVTSRQLSGETRMLPNLTFALDYWRAGGADPQAFKTTNLLIHAVTAFVLVSLFNVLLQLAGLGSQHTRWLSAALAAAWAMHPLQVSSVLYVVQRMQTLSTLFVVLSLLAYVSARRAQVAGRSAAPGFLAATLAWLLALSCKEDSIMLPAYGLALELTLLQFGAADPASSRRLKRAYLAMAVAGAAAYLFFAIPHYWSSTPYAGRDFSTDERLLTQARVLVMYLWQILLPLPSHMSFHYDWLQPSRSLLQPWTTLPSILLILALLAVAWLQRRARPLLSLGTFLFIAAHFTTSNVVGLELAYEHRNHFALVGALLVIGSLLGEVAEILQLRPAARFATCGVLLIALGWNTNVRSQSWSNNLLLAKAVTIAAPHSARGWIQLCAEYFARGGGPIQRNTQLDAAVAACSNGSRLAPGSLNSPALLLVLKTLRGDIMPQDWIDFRQRIGTADRSRDNRRAPGLLTYNARKGVKLDEGELLKVFQAQEQAFALTPRELAATGDFIMFKLGRPEDALPYYLQVMSALPADDPFADQLASGLLEAGRNDLAERVHAASVARQRAEAAATAGPPASPAP